MDVQSRGPKRRCVVTTLKSGLPYEKLRAAADARALETLGKGSWRAHGRRYQAKVSYYDKTGARSKRVDLTMVMRDTETSGRNATGSRELDAKVARWVADIEADIKSISRMDGDTNKSTRDCLEYFIASKMIVGRDGEMIGARHSTLTFYRSCAARIEKSPRLANMPLVDVTKRDVQNWIDVLSETHAAKSVRDSLNVLNQCCKDMLPEGHNPCVGVRVPKNVRRTRKGRTSTRPNYLNMGGIRILNDALDERVAKNGGKPDPFVIGVRIALHTGMRAEEVSGIKWSAVDFANNQIYVTNVIERAYRPETDEDGEQVLRYAEFDSKPKSINSKRAIPLRGELRDMLIDYKRQVSGELAKTKGAGRKDLESLYVIGRADGTHYSPHRLGVNFKKWCRVRNIMGTEKEIIGYHDLRHTFASVTLKEHPEQLAEISAVLGHANTQVTIDKYVGKDPEEQKAFMESVADIFSARTPTDVITLDKTGTTN